MLNRLKAVRAAVNRGLLQKGVEEELMLFQTGQTASGCLENKVLFFAYVGFFLKHVTEKSGNKHLQA